MAELVSLSKDGEIGIITINNPPVNALSPGVPEGISAAIAQVASDDSIKAAVLIGGGRTFIAGADIREFGKITSGENKRGVGLQPHLQNIENCPKPVVAAIHGTALGGGLETTMACHYRVAVEAAQLGQPEVKLGLIPGAGGTQRLPRLAGVTKALDMCIFGEPIKAREAHAAGIVDRVIDGDLLAGAVAFAREVAGKPVPRTCDRNAKLSAPAAVFSDARKKAAQEKQGYMAPQKAIDAIEAATKLPFGQGIEAEEKLFNECLFSNQSKALIYLFFGEREAGKIPDVAKDTPVYPIKAAAVTSGEEIAAMLAKAGVAVVSEVEKADIVVDAGPDLGSISRRVRPECILAISDPAADIDAIAAETDRPQMVIGFHPRMRLLELVRGKATGKETVATSLQLARQLSKIAVVVGNCPGSAGRRMYERYIQKARFEGGGGIDEQAVPAAAEEGGRILEEGKALRPVDLDIIWVHGYGFPAYLGGPMFYLGRH